jgi:hypothetical protein
VGWCRVGLAGLGGGNLGASMGNRVLYAEGVNAGGGEWCGRRQP